MALLCNHPTVILTLFLFLLICFFLNLSPAYAQDSLPDTQKEDCRASAHLGRRSKITLNKTDKEAVRNEDANYAGLALAFDSTGLGVFDAFFASLSMIIVSEIGDEAFIIGALMAKRHPKAIVLSGALAALIIMTFFMLFLG